MEGQRALNSSFAKVFGATVLWYSDGGQSFKVQNLNTLWSGMFLLHSYTATDHSTQVVLGFDKMGLHRKKSSCSQGPSYGLLVVPCIMLLVVPISSLNSQLHASRPSQGQNQPGSISISLATHQPDPYRQSLEIQAVEANKTKVAIIGKSISTNLKLIVLSIKKANFIHISYSVVHRF